MINFIKKILLNSNSSVLIQFFRYVIVGGIAAVVDISLFYAGANVFHIYYIIANTLSFTVGTFVNYFMSRKWVFNKNSGVFTKDFLLFTIIGVIGVMLSNFIMFILIDHRVLYSILSNLSDNYIKLSAKIIAVWIVLFWSFIGRKMIVFERKQKEIGF